jgi:hypothetical protein
MKALNALKRFLITMGEAVIEARKARASAIVKGIGR